MDPNSDESKLAQEAAMKMGVNPEQAKMLTASKFKEFSPTYQKMYELSEKSLDRKERSADRAEDRDFKRDMLALKRDALDRKNIAGKTEGIKALDRDYAKDYNEWTSSGRSSLEKNLLALKEARDALAKDTSLTGGLTGVLGDRFTADRVLKQRQKVNSAIQGSLKATLGSAFTEKEGERILKNAYNEAASADTNKESLNALINQIETQAKNNDEKAKFFEKSGTLSGFEDENLNNQMAGQNTQEFEPDVLRYAERHGMTPEEARNIKMKRTAVAGM